MTLRFAYNTNGAANHRLEDAVALIAEAGYDGVALTLDHHHLDPMAEGWVARTEALGRLLHAKRLGCVIETGARYLLDHELVRAGRHPESDIFLDDITVSRRHAEFASGDDGVEVRDVGSLNGTYVNRARIESARLTSGDEVQIGKFKLVYVRGAGE